MVKKRLPPRSPTPKPSLVVSESFSLLSRTAPSLSPVLPELIPGTLGSAFGTAKNVDVLAILLHEHPGYNVAGVGYLISTDRTDPAVVAIGRVAVGAAVHVHHGILDASTVKAARLRVEGPLAISGEDGGLDSLPGAEHGVANGAGLQELKLVPALSGHRVSQGGVVALAKLYHCGKQPDNNEQ